MSAAHATGKTEVPEELESLKQAGRRYAMPALIGIGVALAAVLVMRYLGDQKSGAEREAMMKLSAASSPVDLEAIVSDYAASATAPLAMLQLASLHYNNAGYTIAQEKYDAFLSAYPENEFAPAAELGRVHCLEALGNLDLALEGYRSFNAKHPGHFLAPQAIMGEGRALEQLGKFEDAKIVYENYIGANPDSRWTDQFESLLDKITLKIASPSLIEYTKPATPPRAVTAPSSSDDFLSSIIAQPLPATAEEPAAMPAPIAIPEPVVVTEPDAAPAPASVIDVGPVENIDSKGESAEQPEVPAAAAIPAAKRQEFAQEENGVAAESESPADTAPAE